jgi:superfamily II DNA or RNA helicase
MPAEVNAPATTLLRQPVYRTNGRSSETSKLRGGKRTAATSGSGQKAGVVKVVTGAGKTIMACGIIERLQVGEAGPRVAVVVP